MNPKVHYDTYACSCITEAMQSFNHCSYLFCETIFQDFFTTRIDFSRIPKFTLTQDLNTADKYFLFCFCLIDFQTFTGPVIFFQDFSVLKNATIKLQDLPGFPGPEKQPVHTSCFGQLDEPTHLIYFELDHNYIFKYQIIFSMRSLFLCRVEIYTSKGRVAFEVCKAKIYPVEGIISTYR